jgi:glycosyltransferase involved in cell wall biosynthesis
MVSFIIPTLNRSRYLKRALESIRVEIEGQESKIEVVIIDGGSSDETARVVEQHSKFIAHFESARDSGVAEAVNKGLARARGDLIRLLGDDDILLPGHTDRMVRHLLAIQPVGGLVGHARFFTEHFDGSMTPTEVSQPVGILTFKRLLRIGEIGWPSPEVGLFKREVFELHGGYDTRFHYLAYLEMWLRWASHGVVLQCVPDVIMHRFLTPSSDTVRGSTEAISKELDKVLWMYGDLEWMVKRGVSRYLSRRGYDTCSRLNIHPMRVVRRLLSVLR